MLHTHNKKMSEQHVFWRYWQQYSGFDCSENLDELNSSLKMYRQNLEFVQKLYDYHDDFSLFKQDLVELTEQKQMDDKMNEKTRQSTAVSNTEAVRDVLLKIPTKDLQNVFDNTPREFMNLLIEIASVTNGLNAKYKELSAVQQKHWLQELKRSSTRVPAVHESFHTYVNQQIARAETEVTVSIEEGKLRTLNSTQFKLVEEVINNVPSNVVRARLLHDFINKHATSMTDANRKELTKLLANTEKQYIMMETKPSEIMDLIFSVADNNLKWEKLRDSIAQLKNSAPTKESKAFMDKVALAFVVTSEAAIGWTKFINLWLDESKKGVARWLYDYFQANKQYETGYSNELNNVIELLGMGQNFDAKAATTTHLKNLFNAFDEVDRFVQGGAELVQSTTAFQTIWSMFLNAKTQAVAKTVLPVLAMWLNWPAFFDLNDARNKLACAANAALTLKTAPWFTIEQQRAYNVLLVEIQTPQVPQTLKQIGEEVGRTLGDVKPDMKNQAWVSEMLSEIKKQFSSSLQTRDLVARAFVGDWAAVPNTKRARIPEGWLETIAGERLAEIKALEEAGAQEYDPEKSFAPSQEGESKTLSELVTDAQNQTAVVPVTTTAETNLSSLLDTIDAAPVTVAAKTKLTETNLNSLLNSLFGRKSEVAPQESDQNQALLLQYLQQRIVDRSVGAEQQQQQQQILKQTNTIRARLADTFKQKLESFNASVPSINFPNNLFNLNAQQLEWAQLVPFAEVWYRDGVFNQTLTRASVSNDEAVATFLIFTALELDAVFRVLAVEVGQDVVQLDVQHDNTVLKTLRWEVDWLPSQAMVVFHAITAFNLIFKTYAGPITSAAAIIDETFIRQLIDSRALTMPPDDDPQTMRFKNELRAKQKIVFAKQDPSFKKLQQENAAGFLGTANTVFISMIQNLDVCADNSKTLLRKLFVQIQHDSTTASPGKKMFLTTLHATLKVYVGSKAAELKTAEARDQILTIWGNVEPKAPHTRQMFSQFKKCTAALPSAPPAPEQNKSNQKKKKTPPPPPPPSQKKAEMKALPSAPPPVEPRRWEDAKQAWFPGVELPIQLLPAEPPQNQEQPSRQSSIPLVEAFLAENAKKASLKSDIVSPLRAEPPKNPEQPSRKRLISLLAELMSGKKRLLSIGAKISLKSEIIDPLNNNRAVSSLQELYEHKYHKAATTEMNKETSKNKKEADQKLLEDIDVAFKVLTKDYKSWLQDKRIYNQYVAEQKRIAAKKANEENEQVEEEGGLSTPNENFG